MSRFNHTPSPEYREFRDKIKEYAEADHEPGEDILTVIADGLADYLEDAFRDGWNADRKADTACIAPMVSDWDECNHNFAMRGDPSDTPPHHPPHADHPDLWVDADGEPVVHASHLYHLERDELKDLLDFADQWGLELRIQSSYYYPNRTTCVCFYPPELLAKWRQDRTDDAP